MEKYHKAPQGKREDIECNPYTIFHQALDNCKPVIGLASIQKGGKFYQVSEIQCFLIKCAVVILYSEIRMIRQGSAPSKRTEKNTVGLGINVSRDAMC